MSIYYFTYDVAKEQIINTEIGNDWLCDCGEEELKSVEHTTVILSI